MLPGKKRRALGVFGAASLRARRRPPFVAGMIVMSLTSFIAACIAIAAATSVPEVTRAPVEIAPTGDFVQIEAPEVATVLSVTVREGDFVKEGTVLATLNAPDLSRQIFTLEAELEGLEDQIANHKIILSALRDPVARAEAGPRGRDVDYATSTLRVLRAKQDTDLQTITRLQNEVTSQRQALGRLAVRRVAREEQVRDTESLFNKGLSTRPQVLSDQDALSEVEDQIHALELSVSANQKEIALLRSKRVQDRLVLQERHVEDLFLAEQQRVLKETELTALVQRRDALDVVAVTDGHVHSVGFPNKGEVVERGETLFELMPSGAALVAVLRIPTRDIGHIEVGKSVELQLETFDARSTLPLTGQIRSLSPNRVFDRDLGEDYFRATVDLETGSPAYAAVQDRLAAGMVVTAEIVTKERSMLEYLLKPIERSLSRTFSER